MVTIMVTVWLPHQWIRQPFRAPLLPAPPLPWSLSNSVRAESAMPLRLRPGRFALQAVASGGLPVPRPKRHDAVFRAVADPTRREILGLLRVRQQSVGELAGNFQMSRPAISKHLRLLRAAGLVATRRSGAAHICSLNAKPLRAIDHWLRDYEAFWKGTLQSLKTYMEGKP